ncbi:hypothetical protein [Kitasatospora sp. NPDC005856]|uniref:hypothetical protein n=1 Tax=Kitasatospora sp. NPDC005856 TaxID=3154566 RepID=UPI003408FF51
MADPLVLAGVPGEAEALGGGELGVAVPAVEEFGLGQEELQGGHHADSALGAGLGDQFDGLLVAPEDQGGAAQLDQVDRALGAGPAGGLDGIPDGRQRPGGPAERGQDGRGQVAGERGEGVVGGEPQDRQAVQDGGHRLLARVPGGVEGLEQHPGGVGRVDVGAGGVEQQPVGGRVRAAPEVRGGPGLVEQCVRQDVVGTAGGLVGERLGVRQLAFLGGGFGGQDEPAGGAVTVRGEPGGALVRGGAAVAAAALGEQPVATGGVWWLAPGLFVDGLGMGLVIAPVTSVVLAGVEPRLAGSAAGVVSTVQQVGGALGIALIGLVHYGAGDPTAAFGHSVLALAALELLLVGLVRFLPHGTPHRG